jgi:hypothetical protein
MAQGVVEWFNLEGFCSCTNPGQGARSALVSGKGGFLHGGLL